MSAELNYLKVSDPNLKQQSDYINKLITDYNN